MQKEILIIGGGGFAKVLVDTIIKEDKYKIMGFCVDNVPMGSSVLEKYTVVSDTKLSNIDKVNNYYFIIALGDNQLRKNFYENAVRKLKPAIIIHPSAIIGSNVQIGVGSVIMANTVINSYTSIGENSIIDTGVIIDHDCKIGNHVHLSLGSIVGSKSIIMDNTTTHIGQHFNSFSK